MNWEEALHFREDDPFPLTTIRIGDSIVKIDQAGKFYPVHEETSWNDFGKTHNPSGLFHPTSDPPVQYEDCGKDDGEVSRWMQDRLLMTETHMNLVWGFVATNDPAAQWRQSSLPTKTIAIAVARSVLDTCYP